MTERARPFPVVLITGMSGAGRTSALKALEDFGFEAVDNLPLRLVDRLLPQAGATADRPLAIAIDSRTRDFGRRRFLELADALKSRADKVDLSVVFLDCDDEALARRFTETRRRHPLADDRPVADGIARERELVAALREHADLLIDTTGLSAHALKQILSERFADADTAQPAVTIISFSYRKGLPREADLVFDVRFLQSPHYVPELQAGTGRDPAVAEYVRADANYAPFMASIRSLLDLLLPNFQREGKSYVTIALGCTGGRHRSVATAEALAQGLRDQDIAVSLRHRELAALEQAPDEMGPDEVAPAELMLGEADRDV